MKVSIGYVDLSEVKLTPAYDLECDAFIFSFRTPGIPFLEFANKDTVVHYSQKTGEISIEDCEDREVRYVFQAPSQDAEALIQLYFNG